MKHIQVPKHFKPIQNFPGYWASPFGEIGTTRRGSFKIRRHTNKNKGCEYPCVSIRRDKKLYTFRVHRLIAICFIENKNGLPFINHKDGDKFNNCTTNLEWCSASDNMKHAYKNNLIKIPTNKKLNENEVLDIREIHNRHKLSYSQIGKIFKVNRGTIGHIIRRETWGHI